jgi:hypothetical protein
MKSSNNTPIADNNISSGSKRKSESCGFNAQEYMENVRKRSREMEKAIDKFEIWTRVYSAKYKFESELTRKVIRDRCNSSKNS